MTCRRFNRSYIRENIEIFVLRTLNIIKRIHTKQKKDHFKAAYSDLHTSGKEILRQNQNSLERARIGFKPVVRKKLHCGLGE